MRTAAPTRELRYGASRTCAPPKPSSTRPRHRATCEDQLSYTELIAEFDGIVTATGAEAGQVVNAGQMIVRLARPTDKDGVFNIAEIGVQTRPAPADKPIEVIVSLLANPGISTDGVVREISPVADPATRTFR